MAKVATSYLEVDPWKIIEKGFHRIRNQVSESIFSLANETMGVRGSFDEGSSKLPTLRGTYFNGVYEYAKEDTPIHYKGIVQRTHFMINSTDFFKVRIEVNQKVLDLGVIDIREFKRELDMKSGLSTRSFIWEMGDHKEIAIRFERFLGMNQTSRAFQKIVINSNFICDIKISFYLDGTIKHWGSDCYYQKKDQGEVDGNPYLLLETLTTKQRLLTMMHIDTNIKAKKEFKQLPQIVESTYEYQANGKDEITFIRYVSNIVEKDPSVDQESILKLGREDLKASILLGYSAQLEENQAYFAEVWKHTDIEIVGDEKNQQGIRFCIFQLQQTYHGDSPVHNIGAKGLTGEAYSGHAFWDTETYCLPFYILNNVEAAKNLLLYRYSTLEQAKERAKDLDCEGACYPIATLNGKEGCNLWQHASLQFQPTTAVAYGIYHYVNVTQDQEFLAKYGLEMLLEICKFLFTRGQWNQNHTHFSYYAVMGPDEFQMMVNHNTYTNYMAKRTFEYTFEVLAKMQDKVSSVFAKTNVDKEVIAAWKAASDAMVILYDENTKLFEQHDGFFDLPHIDIDQIPVTDFPLYSHWSYDRIYRNDMIKQPDVLMFLFLYNQSFSFDVKKANYEFYEPKCIHESSLSPSIHSIFASELGKKEEALEFFGFATRMDLDDYNRNASEGLHTTSIAAAWMNIVYGFGGLRSDGDTLLLHPTIPEIWQQYSFKMNYRGALVKITVTKEHCIIEKEGNDIRIQINDQLYDIINHLEIAL